MCCLGTCKCKLGYLRNAEGECEQPDNFTEKILRMQNITSEPTKAKLVVTSESKVVRLPDSEVSLTVSVSPSSPDEKDVQYQYEWTALTQPPGSLAVKHQNGETLQLTKLSEGLYTFKVSGLVISKKEQIINEGCENIF